MVIIEGYHMVIIEGYHMVIIKGYHMVYGSLINGLHSKNSIFLVPSMDYNFGHDIDDTLPYSKSKKSCKEAKLISTKIMWTSLKNMKSATSTRVFTTTFRTSGNLKNLLIHQ
jgi:hypothetical protein